MHRDIKLENILWTESHQELKLTDFGISKNLRLNDTEFMKTPVGTPSYLAPEIIRGESYTSAVDLWSLGVVLYLLYTILNTVLLTCKIILQLPFCG